MKSFVQLRLGGWTGLVLAGLAVLAASLLPASPSLASDTVYYYSSDSLHSEVVITDQNRNVVERTHYAPYGQVLDRSLRDGPGYTGHAEDPGTGLVYMQQRYYDPEAGRFLSSDPVPASAGEGFNRYAYASNNPYGYYDPDGRASEKTKKQVEDINKPCTGSHIGGQACATLNLSVSQVSAPSPPTSKIASQMISQNPADRVAAAHSAMDYFGIKPAAGQVDITYNQYSDDYADTWELPNDPGHGIVMLGPRAYRTWSHLGSTLGHEIEVHWNTQILFFGNFSGSKDFDWREIQAYKYNIREAQRFGNSPSEMAEFKDLLRRYEYDYKHGPDRIDTQVH